MLDLRMETKVTNFVNAFELARYLSVMTGWAIAILDSPNNRDFAVDLKRGTVWDAYAIGEFLDSHRISMTYGWQDVLQYCCEAGWLEEGSYVVQVKW